MQYFTEISVKRLTGIQHNDKMSTKLQEIQLETQEEIMANIEKLKEKIKESGMTVVAICDKCGISKKTFYNRLKNPDFKIAEALALKETLHLSRSEMKDIFLL